MKAMMLNKISTVSERKLPLVLADLPIPSPGEGEILIKVSVCGVCHTELDEIEGRTPPAAFPIVPGHQVVGRVYAAGAGVGVGAGRFEIGARAGVGWIYSSCRSCSFCESGYENLCSGFVATGRDVNGGYAEYMVVPEDYAYPIPDVFTDAEAAPLLCAGSIGYRSLRLAKLQDGMSLGLTGFGASAHLVLQMAKHKYPASSIYVFARSDREKAFALQLGACWAGDTREASPERLDAIIDTTPAWTPVLEGMKNLKPGGRMVINAIRKEDFDKGALLTLDYSTHLWMEKEIKSVANLTRPDVSEFLSLAAEIPVRPEVEEYSLEDANRALLELKEGRIRGAKVLKIG